MKKKVITSPKVYPPVGPYSQALLINNNLKISGLIGLNPDSTMPNNIETETKNILNYLDNILATAKLTKNHLVHIRVYLTDLNNFAAFNKIYAEYLNNTTYPTRECVEVKALPKSANIEIVAEAITN